MKRWSRHVQGFTLVELLIVAIMKSVIERSAATLSMISHDTHEITQPSS
jgi:Tfp pilus assembly protein PilE